MPAFVHMCFADDIASIRRSGLKAGRFRRGVYAMPVGPQFYPSHQWGRELKRRRNAQMVAVYFKLPSATPVVYGRFNETHAEGTAAEAVAAFLAAPANQGFETIILADVPSSAITSIRRLPKVTGWRYFPAAKGRKPCPCTYCQSGEPFSRRVSGALEEKRQIRLDRRRAAAESRAEGTVDDDNNGDG